jgi:hypothetical protein
MYMYKYMYILIILIAKLFKFLKIFSFHIYCILQGNNVAYFYKIHLPCSLYLEKKTENEKNI